MTVTAWHRDLQLAQRCCPLLTGEFEFVDEPLVFEAGIRQGGAHHPFDAVLFLGLGHDAPQRDHALFAGHHQPDWIADQGIDGDRFHRLGDQLLILILIFGTEQIR